MKKALKTIGTIGGAIAIWMWGTLAYKLGYDACERDVTNARLHEELLRENAKLREELEKSI